MKIVPSKRQWQAWSLPSKLTCVGTYVGVISLIVTVAIVLLPSRETETRPYVVFSSARLIVPDGKSPVEVVFDIRNTGGSEAVGAFEDFTFYFSTHHEQMEFPYKRSSSTRFSLAPSEEWRGYFFPAFVLSPEKLEALDSGKARLFFFARGSYRDSSGKKYELPFSRAYHPKLPGRLAICPDGVTFK